MIVWSVVLGFGLVTSQTLRGIVRDAATRDPLAEAEVLVDGVVAAHTTASGRFRITVLSSAPVDVRVRRIGYEPEDLSIAAPEDDLIEISMTAVEAVALHDLVVRVRQITDIAAGLDYVISREQVESRSYLGEDAYRTLARTPGIAADEMSAQFRMRGAEQEETLVRLDGLTLLDPFHLKDIAGTFSVVDDHWIERTTVSAAGFGAQFGDRTAGAVEFSTVEPSTDSRTLALGVSPTHARVAAEGTLPNGRGGWLVSARRGVPDLVLAALGRGSSYSPAYMDGMAKLTIVPSAGHLVSAHLLLGADRFDVRMDDGLIVSRSRSTRGYGWMRWRSIWSNSLRTETVVSATRIMPGRQVAFHPTYPNGVADDRTLRQLGLRHELEVAGTDVLGVRAGVELFQGEARYDYVFRAPIKILTRGSTTPETPDTSSLFMVQTGTSVSTFIAPHVRLGNRLEIETGVRYDYASHAGRPRIGPRVRGRIGVTRDLALYGSWGLYSQAKGLHELDIVRGEHDWTVQQAIQSTAGMAWRLDPRLQFRAEAYRRIITQPWSRHLNIELGFELVPEIDDDNIAITPARGRAEGVDLELAGRAGANVNWRAGYSLSRVEDLVDGEWVPRTYDQRHAATIDVTWRLSGRWSVAGAWQWHSGWPVAEPNFVDYTIQGGRVVPGYDYRELGSSRLPSYQRLDIGIRHRIPLAGGVLGVNLDVVNVLDRRNVRGLSYDGTLHRDGSLTVRRNALTMAPLAPIVALTWAY